MLQLLADLRTNLLGADTKLDFTSLRLKTILLTFTDAAGRGQPALVAVSSREDSQVATILLRLLQLNIPCTRNGCEHRSELHVFSGGFGW